MFRTQGLHVFSTISGNRKSDKSKNINQKKKYSSTEVVALFQVGYSTSEASLSDSEKFANLDINSGPLYSSDEDSTDVMPDTSPKILLEEYQWEHQIQDKILGSQVRQKMF